MQNKEWKQFASLMLRVESKLASQTIVFPWNRQKHSTWIHANENGEINSTISDLKTMLHKYKCMPARRGCIMYIGVCMHAHEWVGITAKHYYAGFDLLCTCRSQAPNVLFHSVCNKPYSVEWYIIWNGKVKARCEMHDTNTFPIPYYLKQYAILWKHPYEKENLLFAWGIFFPVWVGMVTQEACITPLC